MAGAGGYDARNAARISAEQQHTPIKELAFIHAPDLWILTLS